MVRRGLAGVAYSTSPPLPSQAEMKGQWPEYKGKEGSFFMEGDDKGERWRKMSQSQKSNKNLKQEESQ